MLGKFINRHIGISKTDINKMVGIIGTSNIETLIDDIIPNNIRYNLNETHSLSELDSINSLKTMMKKNNNIKSYYGQGYHSNILPNVINRTVLENPKWYTPYTPYQSEISQGRLESLYNYQTMISELTNLPVTNASLLDESISAVESLNMSYNYYKSPRTQYFCSNDCHPQIIDILKHRAKILDIDLVIDDINNIKINDNLFGALIQYPNTYGHINPYEDIVQDLNTNNILVSCSSDILSLFLLKPPGSWGVDICFGTTQRLGSPMWFGGPHASFISTKPELIRLMPGRIIGKSKDVFEDDVYRIALQTREQHIKKDKATSNICTSQALLANLSSMYTIYNGKNGVINIANEIHDKTKYLANKLSSLGYTIPGTTFFDTIFIKLNPKLSDKINIFLLSKGIAIRKVDNGIIISLDETTTDEDISYLIKLLSIFCKDNCNLAGEILNKFNGLGKFRRNDTFLNQNIFNNYTTESKFTRYVNKLSDKDYGLTHGMIPLGSCTMKLNSVTELLPLGWNELQNCHPYIRNNYFGYHEMISELGELLCDITGFDDISFQSNSGAMGEYAGLLCIKKYHEDKNEKNRKICLIPESAHGTNFSSASLAGLQIVKFNDNIGDEEFKNLVKKYKDDLFGLMITYPNTYGIFAENIKFITNTIHQHGGLVYMDGANMNAQIGYTSPETCGADVCHLNLHKTFCIPHGGGGPGMGPILVNEKLKPFLPKTEQVDILDTSVERISSSEWSSASILSISYLYLKMMGSDGLKQATNIAILNANYIMSRLKDKYEIAFTNDKGRVGHEFIINLKKYNKIGITENDIAKRLIDYSFHPPTMSWPIPGTIMIEPTESESLDELDRFCEAMLNIHKELEEIDIGKYEQDNNVFVNAPHTIKHTINWDFPYSIEKGCFPVNSLYDCKLWASVGRVDNIYGDKILLKNNLK